MASAVRIVNSSRKLPVYSVLRYCTTGSTSAGSKGTEEQPAAGQPTIETQTSFDNSSYKSAQYYSYNEMSFYDIELDMMKHRIKQPSKHDQLKPPSK